VYRDIGWVTGIRMWCTAAAKRRYRDDVRGRSNWPDFSRFWKIIDDHRVTIFYTAPTAIRPSSSGATSTSKSTLGLAASARHRRRTYQPELDVVSREDRSQPLPHRRYLVANETGHPDRAHSRRRAHKPARPRGPFRIQPEWSTRRAAVACWPWRPAHRAQPWPSMARTIYGDPERYQKTYWSDIEAVLTATGTPGRRRLLLADGPRGRCDQRKWHRLGTMEVESALVAHPSGRGCRRGPPRRLKGQASPPLSRWKAERAPAKS